MALRLTQALTRSEALRGRETSLVDGSMRFSWTHILQRIARLAGGLRAKGLADGDRVAVLALNSHRVFECFYATIWAGGIVAPLNHRLSPQEIEWQLTNIEPAVLFLGPEFLHLLPALPGTLRDKVVMCCDDRDATNGMISHEALIAGAEPQPETVRQGDDVALLFHTGGTTGEPKGVMLSHENMVANSINFITEMGMDEHTVHLHCGPLFHVAAAARLFSVTQVAATHVILPRFSAIEVLRTIEREHVTLATFVPTMIRTILDAPELAQFDLSSLRYITYGAAPMPERLLRELMHTLPHVRLVQSYGMTETSPIATMLGHRDHMTEAMKPERLRSAGRPAILSEIRIVDGLDEPVPRGARGEIVVRGPMVMRGYWRNEPATAQVLRSGWMHTGDLGYLDEDGYLYVVDRLKDVIISGGENIYSQEIENAISAHPAVRACAVVGIPDERWGETVHAVVVPRPGMSVTEADILKHCRDRIAGYKCPKSVDIRTSDLPLSGANKVVKSVLRAEIERARSDGLPAAGL